MRIVFIILSAFICLAASSNVALAEKIAGYAEFRKGLFLVVDGQRLVAAPGARIKGAGNINAVALGSEVTAEGRRRSDGAVVVSQLEAKPNGSAFGEKDIIAATNEAEAEYRRAGRFYQKTDKGEKTVGKLEETGPRVERVRRITSTLLPPYLDRGAVRAYVIDNKDWNAFAMANGSVYVFSGLLNDMNDDEVAIVLGHELTHATYEHSRRQMKTGMIAQIVALGVMAGAQSIDDKNKRAAAQIITALGATAYSSGYGRDLEDQADRVGLRYAYEGGYDVERGPALWQRFAKKYGEGNSVANFFFADHSQASARARNLERELANNYRKGRAAAE
jgi:hypothetical protein